ncbi:glycosyltransferase family 2 protein [Vreelandella stevensii]|uniref:glycosyltransferase family 2 protein n=1 Tax=Vreelandella stevensii TaxID=502821 RepID=UPI00403AC385
MENSLITVVIPCYNVESYIEECMNSVLNQTYANIEVLAVNDGSTDKTLDYLEGYANKDDRIKVIDQSNTGLGAARNAALPYISGEYVTFLDSDDYLAKDALENLSNEAVRTNADITIGARVKFTSKKTFVSPQALFEKNNQGYAHDFTAVYGLVAVHGKLFKSSFFFKNKLKFQEIRAQEDCAFTYLAYYKASVVAVIKESVYYYRKREPGQPSITQSRLKDSSLLGRFAQIEATIAMSRTGKGEKIYPRVNVYNLEFGSRLMRHINAFSKSKNSAESLNALKMIADYSEAYKTNILKECNKRVVGIYEAVWSRDILAVKAQLKKK